MKFNPSILALAGRSLLVLSLLSTPQNSFGEEAGAKPQAAASAPAPAASAPAPAPVQVKPVIPDLPVVEQDPQGESIYTVTLSDQDGPDDHDILITRRSGRTYAFKYCRAFKHDGQKTNVYPLRLMRAKLPNLLKDKAIASEFLKKYYDSPVCEPFMDDSVYIETKHFDVDSNHQSSTGADTGLYGTISTVSGVASLFVGYKGLKDASTARSLNSTPSTTKFVFSKSFPRGKMAAFIFLIGLSTYAGKESALKHLENKGIDAIADSSYSYFYDRDGANESYTERVVPSMTEFKAHFETGLHFLVNEKYFTKL